MLPNSVSARCERAICVPRYQPPSSEWSSGRRAVHKKKDKSAIQMGMTDSMGNNQGSPDAHLFLDQSQLLQVAFQKRHLFLLCLAVAVTDHIIVLLLDFVKLNFELDNLER